MSSSHLPPSSEGATKMVDLELADLEQRLRHWGYKPRHAARVMRAFYGGNEVTHSASCSLPKGLLERVRAEFASQAATLAARQTASDGTTKLLLRLDDGRTVESVLMPDYRADRAAGCISSQVGCSMGCDFCATTKSGFERNLTSGEIVEQFLALRREARSMGRNLQTLVFMGMGEPMLNLESVLEAVRRLADNSLGAMGWRQITISTVGIVSGIDALTSTGLNLNLAISLHAPDDLTRARLLPVGKRFPIADILAAADRFQARRGRPVTLQYCLLAGVNDSVDHAQMLADIVGSRRMHVNLLRYNPTGLSLRGIEYQASSDETSEAFTSVLRARKVVAHFRRSRGPDIDAACGQLQARRSANGKDAEV
ncbi:MAG: 23S rRNA (adenine(2503)-C(2))-methyltransferase RlmN [Verrucomicrobiales bacterium]|nr:23S rRNA (adenine(2503)-C(2))-methyltransferase RlmN [Verrucomicrobiales bacterium]